jgi:hypothetical protein
MTQYNSLEITEGEMKMRKNRKMALKLRLVIF